MNLTEYTFLLNKPDAISSRHTVTLEKIVEEFPYFQSARALRLKGLYNEDSYKYNFALKVAAAHTTDRSVLFDFITSDTFTAIQKGLYDQKLAELHEIVVTGIEVVTEARREEKIDPAVQSVLSSISESAPQLELQVETQQEIQPAEQPDEKILAAEKLEIGRPLEFSRDEKHSFQEWLQLSSFKPIDRQPEVEETIATQQDPAELEKQKKTALINRFIEANPKISAVKHDVTPIAVEPSKSDDSYLMTETLARVYLEQKKYQKAIQAYQILILKYPEKSSFFADRILDIKNLQQQ